MLRLATACACLQKKKERRSAMIAAIGANGCKKKRKSLPTEKFGFEQLLHFGKLLALV